MSDQNTIDAGYLFDSAPDAPDVYVGDEADGYSTFEIEQVKTPHSVETDPWEDYRSTVLDRYDGISRARDKFQYKKDRVTRRAELADIIGVLHQKQPELIPEELCENLEFRKYINTFINSENYDKLHRRTMHNTTLSEIAAEHTAAAYYKMLYEVEQQKQKQKQQQPQDGTGDKENQQQGGSTPEQQQQSVDNAMKEAMKDVDEASDFMSALGAGKENGANDKQSTDLIVQLYKQYKKSPMLQKILQAAGHYMVVAKRLQRDKISNDPEEVVDVTKSRDLAHLVPSEYAIWANNEDMFWARFVNGQCLSYKFGSQASNEAGPVMVFCDESGSMHGQRIVEAKAISLTMAWIAIHQNRWCRLVGFYTGYGFNSTTLDPAEPAYERSKKLITWLENFNGGGTCLSFLHRDNIEREFELSQAPRGETDILLVTDAAGISGDQDGIIDSGFMKWKIENECRLITIRVGGNKPELERISDMAFGHLQLTADAEGVAAAFDIGHREQPEQEQE